MQQQGQDWQDFNPFHVVIDDLLRRIAREKVARPPWYRALTQLKPDSPAEERLSVYRAIRDSGALPVEAGFFLVASQFHLVVGHYAETALEPLDRELETIQREYGLSDDDLRSSGERPPEYSEVLSRHHAVWDTVFAAKLEDFGEHEMARLFRTDRKHFEELFEAGRQFFDGPPPYVDPDDTAWLHDLQTDVAQCMKADIELGRMGPLGFRYENETSLWQVTIYPLRLALVDGPDSDTVVMPEFTLDLVRLQSLFELVVSFGWDAVGLEFPGEQDVYIEGVYKGHDIFLRVLPLAPQDERRVIKFKRQGGSR